MPLLHLSARHTAQEAHDLVAAACAGRDRVWGRDAFQRVGFLTASEVLAPLRRTYVSEDEPSVAVTRIAGQP